MYDSSFNAVKVLQQLFILNFLRVPYWWSKSKHPFYALEQKALLWFLSVFFLLSDYNCRKCNKQYLHFVETTRHTWTPMPPTFPKTNLRTHRTNTRNVSSPTLVAHKKTQIHVSVDRTLRILRTRIYRTPPKSNNKPSKLFGVLQLQFLSNKLQSFLQFDLCLRLW